MTLIGYWPLNETEGDTAFDHSGNENHGAINEATIDALGLLGQNSYDFDGNGEVDCGNAEILNIDNWTISCWVLFDSDPSQEMTVVGKWGPDSYNYLLRMDGSNLEGRTHPEDQSSESVLYSSGNLNMSRWYHFCFSYDGITLRLYVDGHEKDTNQINEESIDESSNPLQIGNRASSDSGFKGKIQEVRLYDRALSAGEVQYLYNVGRRGRFVSRKKQP